MANTLRHPSFDPPGPGVPPPPLTDAVAALDVVLLAASDPPSVETVVLFLDDAHCGRTCCVVSGTIVPDAVLDVAALAAESASLSPAVHAVVLASVRDVPASVGDLDGDVQRWLVLLDLFDDVGIDVLDWFVIGPGSRVRSLREHTGMPPLWRGPRPLVADAIGIESGCPVLRPTADH